MKWILVGACLLVLVAVTVSSAGAVSYEVYDLTSAFLTAPLSCYTTGVNDSGQVVGYAQVTSSQLQAVIWTEGPSGPGGTRSFEVTTLGYGTASAINNAGHIAGYMSNFTNGNNAYLWDAPGGVQNWEGIVADGVGGVALTINNSGQAAGYSGTNHSPTVWSTVDGSVVGPTFGNLGGPAQIRDINDNGRCVGSSLDGNVVEHGVVWADDGSVRYTLESVRSRAYAVNNAGLVVGFYDSGSNNYRAQIWDSSTGVRIKNLGGPNFSQAFNINNLNYIVGQFSNAACIWDGNDPNYARTDLPVFEGATKSQAWGINDNGWISGFAVDSMGMNHALLWIPDVVPEPSSLVVLISGLAGACGTMILRGRAGR